MNKQTSFRDLFTEHKGKVSDKWSLYLDEWDRLFRAYRDLPIYLFEIGIQNGGSLEIWADYFSQADKIVGCDIDDKCGELKFFNDRIQVVVGDANTDECESEILQLAPAYDIIIDDGSHKSIDIIRSFARYFPILKDDGIYVVEDLHASYWNEFGGGLHNPLSAMAFFKRLTDVLNYEHWRSNKPRINLLEKYSGEFCVEFDDLDLARIHSIEFVNSLCIIKKFTPDKNKLGVRKVVGREELVTTGCKKWDGTSIQDTVVSIENDEDLDVFSLMSKAQAAFDLVSNREQKIQTLKAQILEQTRQIQTIETQLAERAQQVRTLNGQLLQAQNELQTAKNEILNYALSTSWQFTRPLRKIKKFFTRLITR